MQRSEAWQDLNTVARCAYVELSRRYRGPGSNNGRIGYSVRELTTALRVSKATASRALNSLQTHGFIVAMKKGAFNWKVRHSTEWRLTEFPCDVTGALPTKEFARWKKNMVSTEVPIDPPHETARSPS
jgi:hypothetical protein